ncbi:M48 family metallopeptidase [Echinicola salinicaeni]|uniref:M48 family metallopeptidase n=1 Tax=Echinicola salinicaeni TaxID=2762757 RepID=UPI001647186F|nr:M48 family metallopeptidase [Echinicola salinicaeni]
MKKVFLQSFLLLALFLFCWFSLAQINWTSIFEVEKSGQELEEKLGEQLWEIYSREGREVFNDDIIQSLDTIIHTICHANKIDQESIKLHVLEKDEINAFAMPNGHLVIYTGLIKASENPEELAGVISHEIAHIELNHVMKKLAKEMGISMLISITTGNGGAIAEVAKLLSSSAFDRDQEKAADLQASDYLVNAKIDPKHFADFLYRLSLDDPEIMRYITWISTHPNSNDRAQNIIEYQEGNLVISEPILDNATWKEIKTLVQ